jgi:NADH dehydrogenase [ubiquinone] 1 alpha subcomplex assembly factor 1
MAQEQLIYDFKSSENPEDWTIVNDGVMGGLSTSSINLNAEGHAVFTGNISLKNNGGFSSVRHFTNISNVGRYKYINLKVRGNPSTYQFRLKKKREDYYSYVNTFEVTPTWKTIKLEISEFYPTYRGRSLDLPNFEAMSIEEVTFLIGNKVVEEFKLEIDKIFLSN